MDAAKAKVTTEKTVRRKTSSIARKSILGLMALLVVFSVVTGYLGYDRFSKSILEQYSDGGILTAETAATIINGDDLYRLSRSNGETGEYRKLKNEIQTLCNSSGSTFIYVIQPDTSDYRHIRFILSTANYESDFTPYEFGYLRETTNDEYREKYAKMYNGSSNREIVVRDRGYIETDTHITAMVPVRGSDNKVKAIICVQRQLDVLTEIRNQYVKNVLIVLAILAALVIAGQSLYLHRTLLDPIQKITEEAERFAEENVTSSEKLTDSVRNKDEIGLLAWSIDQMEEKTQAYIEDITRITAEKERMGAELSLAARIQESALPSDFPAFPDRDEFDIYASMTPAKEVGGDFYDFFMVDEDHLAAIIADVSGKGIPAALFMMSSKLMIENQAMNDLSPAEILEAVNDQISKNNNEEMFVTVWLGILDLKTGVMTAANAGHEYPVLMTPGGEFELLKDRHGFVIGGMEGMKFTDYTIDMPAGSKLFLYTDGLPEAQNMEGAFFGTDRMLESLNLLRDEKPQQILGGMRRAAMEFEDKAQRFDDLTMLCLESKVKK